MNPRQEQASLYFLLTKARLKSLKTIFPALFGVLTREAAALTWAEGWVSMSIPENGLSMHGDVIGHFKSQRAKGVFWHPCDRNTPETMFASTTYFVYMWWTNFIILNLTSIYKGNSIWCEFQWLQYTSLCFWIFSYYIFFASLVSLSFSFSICKRRRRPKGASMGTLV